VELAKAAVIPATHQAAQLEWLSHAVKGFSVDFEFGEPSGQAVER